VQFYALSCVAHSPICDAYDIEGFPTILGFPLLRLEDRSKLDSDADAVYQYHDSPIRLNPHGLSDMTPDLLSDNLEFSVTRVSSSPLDNNNNKKLQNFASEEEREEWEAKFESFAADAITRIQSRMEYPKHLTDTYMDAALSFVFALEEGVRYQHHHEGAGAGGGSKQQTTLSSENVAILDRFLDVLLWTAPSSWGFYNLIQDIQLEMSTIRRGRSHLKEVLHRHDSSSWGIVGIHNQEPRQFNSVRTTSWSEGCTHGNAGAGFTCGLWQLFHIITVGAAEQHEASLSSGHHDIASISTLAVADAIKDFVQSFFGCAVCRDNFVTAYNQCAFEVCQRLTSDVIPATISDARELPLWLWEMHNAVNTRLVQEDSFENEWRNASQIELDLAVFPNPRMCPQCRKERSPTTLKMLLDAEKQERNRVAASATGLSTSTGDLLGPFGHIEKATDIQWDTNAVFTFLRNYYW
jgi:hypothetical protein